MRALGRVTPPVRSFVARRKRFAALIEDLMYRFPPLEDAVVALIRGDPQLRYERWIALYDTIDETNLERMRADVATLAEPPSFSIVVAQTDASVAVPDALEQSLRAQVYPHWELGDMNGDYVLIVDPGVALRPHALYLFARAITANPDLVLLYADEDELSPAGRRTNHYFKPDWNPRLLRSQDYLGGVVCLRRADADGARSTAWDVALRVGASARPEQIHHVPFVLFHRARGDERQSRDRRSRGAGALERSLAGIGEPMDVEPVGEQSYRTRYPLPPDTPPVSIIVPTTCRLDVLEPCIRSLFDRTTYPQLELLLVVNGTRGLTREQRTFLDGIEKRPQARVLFHEERPYNFARINNWAVEQARGDVLCFLNDDTEVITGEWLSGMVSEVLQERVAAVGAMLLFPNDRIQHAGAILGVGGVAQHTYKGKRRNTSGYNERALVAQDVSCVTAACMVVRREAFSGVGCFDPTFAVSFNDVELCLRLRAAGWRIVWTPAAVLYHKESASIGRHHLGAFARQWAIDYDLIRERWHAQLFADPHYSPNLSLDGLEVWEPAFPPRVTYPWRAS